MPQVKGHFSDPSLPCRALSCPIMPVINVFRPVSSAPAVGRQLDHMSGQEIESSVSELEAIYIPCTDKHHL